MDEVRTHVLETDRGEILVEDGGRVEELERHFTDRATARANWRQDAETTLATCSRSGGLAGALGRPGGAGDRNMPPVHGHRIAQLVPGIQAYFPDEDHTTIEDDHRTEAYNWLIARRR
ncbi:hypothetical protein [Kribbella sp. NPDC048928]|uniref:hypothetical protein n=1 Tax=Kribbella sp. NPDC048928 TaxID=3364111 RepID=UPI003713A444